MVNGSQQRGIIRKKRVVTRGDTVFVDGKGFSVAPVEQPKFIKRVTSGGTSTPAPAPMSTLETPTEAATKPLTAEQQAIKTRGADLQAKESEKLLAVIREKAGKVERGEIKSFEFAGALESGQPVRRITLIRGGDLTGRLTATGVEPEVLPRKVRESTVTSSILPGGQKRPVSEVQPVEQRGLIPSTFGRTIFAIGKAEKRVSEVFIQPFTEPLIERGFTLEKFSSITGLAQAKITPISKKEEVAGFQKGFQKGVVGDIAEKPLQNLATLGLGFAIGGGVKLGTVGGKVLGGAIGGVRGAGIGAKTVQIGSGVVGIGLTGVFVTSVGKEAISSGSPEAFGETVGIASKDIALLGIGGFAGERAGTKLVGKLRTRGLTEVPLESISEPKVLTGETKFPFESPKETTKQFKARFLESRLPGEEAGVPRAFTATDVELLAKAEVIGIGKPIKIKSSLPGAKTDVLTGEQLPAGFETIKSELPGVFGADVVSTAFLRSGKEATRPKLFSFFGDLGGEPTVIRRTLKGIVLPETLGGKLVGRSPERIIELETLLGGRRGLPFKEIQQIPAELPLGQAVAPRIKAEREVIIVKGTKERVTQKKFFFELEGQKIPIFEKTAEGIINFKPPKKGITKSPLNKLKSNLELVSSDLGSFARPSIITPARIGGSILRGSPRKKPALVSGLPSKISSLESTLKPSKIISPISSKTQPFKSSDILGKSSLKSLSPKSFLKSPLQSSSIFPSVSRRIKKGRIVAPLDFSRVLIPSKSRPPVDRLFVRTPSFGAVVKEFDLGFKQPKFSKELETTGLFARKFVKPQELPQLGPVRRRRK